MKENPFKIRKPDKVKADASSGGSPKRTKDVFFWTTIAKYLASFIITCAAAKTHGLQIFLIGILELVIIFVTSEQLIKFRIFGWIINSLLILLYDVQIAVLIFGNSFITLIMLTNLSSIEDLSGHAVLYISAIIFVLIFSFIPIRRLGLPVPMRKEVLSAALAVELVATMIVGNIYSPLYAYADIAIQISDSQAQKNKIAQLSNQFASAQSRQAGETDEAAADGSISPESGAETADGISGLIASASDQAKEEKNKVEHLTIDDGTFYKEEITDYRAKDSTLPENPNIVLIFTEGLSQNIVDDEREIMPNVAEYQKKSLSFDNYYNHTFATYRGLSGQLFSGHQYDNTDINYLISIEEIFSERGYFTTFYNTEPNNAEFTEYLRNLRFDEFISSEGSQNEGAANTLSDKQAYDGLFDYLSGISGGSTPTFTAIYTFGTHVSLNSKDQVYGNGSDPMLNKFYDVDYQFGQFMDKFMSSPMSDNTIIIFTADHSTFSESAFTSAFPKVERVCSDVDAVPFFIYYKGIKPETIDVNGRNSLDLAPTICDYLDITAPNYFLGVSLFAEDGNDYDTVFWDPTYTMSTANSTIAPFTGVAREAFDDNLEYYFALKLTRPTS